MINLKDTSNEKLLNNKTVLKTTIIVQVLMNIIVWCYYFYQGSQRGFDDVVGLKDDFLSTSKFSFVCIFLTLIYMNYIDKELNSRGET
jgi:hypothetical protein